MKSEWVARGTCFGDVASSPVPTPPPPQTRKKEKPTDQTATPISPIVFASEGRSFWFFCGRPCSFFPFHSLWSSSFSSSSFPSTEFRFLHLFGVLALFAQIIHSLVLLAPRRSSSLPPFLYVPLVTVVVALLLSSLFSLSFPFSPFLFFWCMVKKGGENGGWARSAVPRRSTQGRSRMHRQTKCYPPTYLHTWYVHKHARDRQD